MRSLISVRSVVQLYPGPLSARCRRGRPRRERPAATSRFPRVPVTVLSMKARRLSGLVAALLAAQLGVAPRDASCASPSNTVPAESAHHQGHVPASDSHNRRTPPVQHGHTVPICCQALAPCSTCVSSGASTITFTSKPIQLGVDPRVDELSPSRFLAPDTPPPRRKAK
jgi:hypothetical protein